MNPPPRFSDIYICVCVWVCVCVYIYEVHTRVLYMKSQGTHL